MEKKSKKKKEKKEVAETSSQGKEQFEGESSQLSERSVSSPATQTPSSSPALKGTFSVLVYLQNNTLNKSTMFSHGLQSFSWKVLYMALW